MRMNVIASFVLDRQYIERLDRMAAARMRYKQYLVDVRRDSASESEDEDEGAENDWIELFDDKLNVPYWVNNTTGDKTFEEPPDDDAIIKSILHQRVRILWVAQDAWFEGYTSAYHRRKGRFKVEYDDGDHEWLDIIKNEDRVQIMSADGSWVMLNMHRSDEMLHERNKKAAALYNIDAKAEAWRDAEQWTRVSEESDEKIMFISDITGAIRAGSEDANFWTIQDDGLGFPLFYNIETQAKVFEDPRFLSDVSEDVDNQREFVMQELRYSTYFCKEMLEVYQRAEFEKREAAKAFQLKLIARSNKPKLLTAFLIRAKALYTPQSVVDKPCDEGVRSELEYASWLAAEISVLVSRGEETKMAVAKQRVEKLHEVLGSTTYYHNPPTEEELEKQRLIEEKKLLEEKRIEDERRAEEERILAEKKKAEEEEAAAAAVAEAEAAAAAAAEALASRKVKRQSSKKSVAESPKSSVKKRKPVRRAPSQKKL